LATRKIRWHVGAISLNTNEIPATLQLVTKQGTQRRKSKRTKRDALVKKAQSNTSIHLFEIREAYLGCFTNNDARSNDAFHS
jgi:hypothetical protein